MSSLSTHVLDAVRGVPAAGVEVSLSSWDGDQWSARGSGVTDADGRISEFASDLAPGVHRLVFATEPYLEATSGSSFFPEVSIAFRVDEERHYHVPLLLSPYAYSTYRGS